MVVEFCRSDMQITVRALGFKSNKTIEVIRIAGDRFGDGGREGLDFTAMRRDDSDGALPSYRANVIVDTFCFTSLKLLKGAVSISHNLRPPSPSP